MALTLESTQRLYRAGRYLELLAGHTDSPKLRGLAPGHRMLVAAALQRTGAITKAAEIATHELATNPPDGIRSHCELLLGMSSRHATNLTDALTHYERSLQLALKVGDHVQAAWASLHLLRMRAEVQRPDELVAVLRNVRTHVTRAGDPQVAAYMHDTVALMEASAGRLHEARRHLAISRALIQLDLNAWLEQVNLVSSSYVDFYDCRYRDALRHLEDARRLSAIVGFAQRFVVDCNHGHALLVAGKFGPARARFEEAIKGGAGLTRLGAMDGLARTQLMTGHLDECEATLLEIDALSGADERLTAAFAGRWTAVTRVQLLLRRRRYLDADAEARRWLERVSRPDDRVWEFQLLCLRVEALARSGGSAEATRLLFSQLASEHRLKGGFQATSIRAVGVLLSVAGSEAGPQMLTRARRIWAEQGNVSAELDMKEVENTLKGPSITSDAASQIVSAIANGFNLSHSPSLLARELKTAIEASGLSERVRVAEHGTSTSPAQHSEDIRTLQLGESDGKALTLLCDLPLEPARAALLDDLLTIGRAAVDLEKSREEAKSRSALWPEEPRASKDNVLFIAEEMQALLATARRVANTDVPVLITGETGTGKEILARTIHAYSNRAKAAFLPFNCSSTPKDMLDSQLFGHRRGAFTGATDNFTGIIRAAAGGTLFLDEIGDMGLEVQPKLLRFLESGEVHPVGEATPTRVDVRVIAATNAPLDRLVGEGAFREDLFYRLNIVRLHLPPLRERRVEIPALAAHYLAKYAAEYSKGALRFAEETMEYLVLYRWPGNVRQLANEMRRMAALAEPGAIMMPEHLATELAASRRTIPASERILEPTEVVVRLDQPMAAGVQHLERAMTQYALKKCGGRMEETAAMLGLSRKGLYLKRQRFGIEPPTAAGNGGPSS